MFPYIINNVDLQSKRAFIILHKHSYMELITNRVLSEGKLCYIVATKDPITMVDVKWRMKIKTQIV